MQTVAKKKTPTKKVGGRPGWALLCAERGADRRGHGAEAAAACAAGAGVAMATCSRPFSPMLAASSLTLQKAAPKKA